MRLHPANRQGEARGPPPSIQLHYADRKVVKAEEDMLPRRSLNRSHFAKASWCGNAVALDILFASGCMPKSSGESHSHNNVVWKRQFILEIIYVIPHFKNRGPECYEISILAISSS